MGWSTKVAIGGVIHGSQVNRHPPHHPPSSYSLVGARLKHFSLIVRLYGFEGEAGREGEGFTRNRESSHRRYFALPEARREASEARMKAWER